MLKAVYSSINTSGQFSFEERMGCGFEHAWDAAARQNTEERGYARTAPFLRRRR